MYLTRSVVGDINGKHIILIIYYIMLVLIFFINGSDIYAMTDLYELIFVIYCIDKMKCMKVACKRLTNEDFLFYVLYI